MALHLHNIIKAKVQKRECERRTQETHAKKDLPMRTIRQTQNPNAYYQTNTDVYI
jgi:hypothetical protein